MRKLPLEPPRPFLYTQRLQTKLDISIARRCLKLNRHLHSILLSCSAKRWKLWKQTWLNFAIVSKISTQGEAYQKALFLCTIGQSALEIFNAFQFTASEDPNRAGTIIAKFDEYFTGDVNETYERYKFNQRNQEAGENFDAYLTTLRNMTDTCNFCTCPTMKDSLIRDRIVLGIRNDDAGKRLLQERKLNLYRYLSNLGEHHNSYASDRWKTRGSSLD